MHELPDPARPGVNLVDVEPALERGPDGPGHTDAYWIGGTDLGATVTDRTADWALVFGDTFERPPSAAAGAPRSGVRYGLGAHRAGLDRVGRGRVVRAPGRRLPASAEVDAATSSPCCPPTCCARAECSPARDGVPGAGGHVWWTELYRSTDNGVSWEPTGCRWSGDHQDGLFQTPTWERGGDAVYAFTTGFQRQHGMILHRVPEDRVTSRSDCSPGASTPTVGLGKHLPALPGGSASCRYDERRWPGTRRWTRRVLRRRCVPDGRARPLTHRAPRGPRRAAATGRRGPRARRVAQLYGGYILPGSTWARLFLVVSQWNTGTNWPYHTMQFEADVSQRRRR